MTKKTKTANKPAFLAYHVPERENPFWTRIGAMWPHDDGEGFTLQLELMPLDGSRIVLRRREDETAPETGEGEGA